MKLVSIAQNNTDRVGLLIDQNVYLLNEINTAIPSNMKAMLEDWETCATLAKTIESDIKSGALSVTALNVNEVTLLAPVPHPTSCRDGYAFRQHVASARRNRGVEMIPEFDQYPIFYFTNHNAVQGPGEVLCMKDHFEKLDFELEASIVIGKR